MLYFDLKKAGLAFCYAGTLLLPLAPRIASADPIFYLTTNGRADAPKTGTCSVVPGGKVGIGGGWVLQSCTNTMDIIATDLHVFADFRDPNDPSALPKYPSPIKPFLPIRVLPGESFSPPEDKWLLYNTSTAALAQNEGLALHVYGYWSTCEAPPRSESGLSSTASTGPGTCPIPEPETSMLMVGGLTGLAFVTTRRRKGAAN